MKLWWINLIRGFVAIGLGIAIALEPTGARSTMLNFMSIYWIASGFLSLRASRVVTNKRGLLIAAGLIGVVGGVIILLRSLYHEAMPEEILVNMFALILITTGLMHLFRGFRTSEVLTCEQSLTSYALGALEVFLGLYVFVSQSLDPRLRFVASLWAGVSGATLMYDAFRLRKLTPEEAEEIVERIEEAAD
ncbi:MAG: hypothetical protein GTO18_14705 [Anaerolineales bacterium]|nr:hypothetical protein [Anaerolineales bacterium]